MIQAIFIYVKGVLLALLVILSCFGFNLIQLIMFPLYYIAPAVNYYFQSFLLGAQIRLMHFVFTKIQGAQITYSGHKLDVGSSAFVLSNHQSWSDFYMIGALAIHFGMEPYNRYFIKDSVKYLPIFGWGLYFTGQLFMKRNWESDVNQIDRIFGTIWHYKLPVWVISYPEGSRFSTEKHQEALAFAKSRSLPKFENVLVPRTKGPIAVITKLRKSHVEYVYDVTMAYRNINYSPNEGFRLNPNLFRIHFSNWISPPYQYHIHVEKFLLNDLSTDHRELSNWILDRFQKKDALLASLKSKGWTDNLSKSHQVRLSP